jgi:oligoendopeptidase F
MTTKVKTLPKRNEVAAADTWDLASLYANDAEWEAAFTAWEGRIAGYDAFRGKLGASPRDLADCLRFDTEFERVGERLGTYAFLKTAEDTASSAYQRMIGRYRNVASRASQAASYIRPEIRWTNS